VSSTVCTAGKRTFSAVVLQAVMNYILPQFTLAPGPKQAGLRQAGYPHSEAVETTI